MEILKKGATSPEPAVKRTRPTMSVEQDALYSNLTKENGFSVAGALEAFAGVTADAELPAVKGGAALAYSRTRKPENQP